MKEFFKENEKFSMIRLLSFITTVLTLFISVVVIILVLLQYKLDYIRELIYLIGTLLSLGLGGKVIQKFSEADGNKK